MEVKDCRQLTFVLDNCMYGFSIRFVHEVIGLIDITKVPKTPDYIRGIINLRGQIIPVLDLRLKLEMPKMEYNERTCIIIASVNISSTEKTIGIVVDSIAEVLDIEPSEIEPPPVYNSSENTKLLKGIGKFKNKIIMLLDIDEIVNEEEITNYFEQETENNLSPI